MNLAQKMYLQCEKDQKHVPIVTKVANLAKFVIKTKRFSDLLTCLLAGELPKRSKPGGRVNGPGGPISGSYVIARSKIFHILMFSISMIPMK